MSLILTETIGFTCFAKCHIMCSLDQLDHYFCDLWLILHIFSFIRPAFPKAGLFFAWNLRFLLLLWSREGYLWRQWIRAGKEKCTNSVRKNHWNVFNRIKKSPVFCKTGLFSPKFVGEFKITAEDDLKLPQCCALCTKLYQFKICF